MASVSDEYNKVALKLLEKADEALGTNIGPNDLLKIAEAIAWVRYPNQTHGGGQVVLK